MCGRRSVSNGVRIAVSRDKGELTYYTTDALENPPLRRAHPPRKIGQYQGFPPG